MSYYNPNWKWAIVKKGTCHIEGRYVHKKRAYTELNKSMHSDKLEVISYEAYTERSSRKVTVKNLMTGKPVQIEACQVGGPCDPSTERYWAM